MGNKSGDDYYNNFDPSEFVKEEEVKIYDIEELFGEQVFDNMENIILGTSTLFLFTYLLVSIVWSKDILIVFKTFRSNPRLNFQIIWDCLRLRNPVIR